MKTLTILAVFSLVLFSMFAVSAKTFVIGKVYDQKYGSSGLVGVDMTINCGGSSWTGNSQTEGTYAAVFNVSDCKEGKEMNVSISKTDYVSRSFSGTYDGTNLSNLNPIKQESERFLIVNFVMEKVEVTPTPTNTGGGSSGGGNGGGGSGCVSSLWDCKEWSACTNSTQTRNCVSNCASKRTETRSCVEPSGTEQPNGSEDEEEIVEQGFFSAITGAVVGTLGTTGAIVAVVFVIAVVVALAFVKMRKPAVEKKGK